MSAHGQVTVKQNSEKLNKLEAENIESVNVAVK